jgi:hypothetical protein
MTWFIRIIPVTYLANTGSRPEPEHSREEESGKSQSDARCGEQSRRIDAAMVFVICSRRDQRLPIGCRGECKMTGFSTKTLLIAAAFGALTTSAFAQALAPAPWVLTPDMGYGYDKEGKTYSYKMGTSNAGLLLKGAKKVPKGTLFFIGQNGQLYMRTGPYLESDGRFMFGPG